MSFIEIAKVSKHYGAFQALHDVTLSIPKGEFVTLLGPSGSGKTTLLKVLAGFEPVSAGGILLEGRDITRVPPEKRNFGLVFQGYALFPHMTVHDNIAYPLRVRRRPRAEIEERVTALLRLVQLERFAARKPQELSGGQQQRVALARALVFKPDLLLLDEPMSALDKKLRHDLQEELRAIHQTLGTTFINVTHDQEEAMHMSDRIAVMNQGRVEQFDTAHTLYRKPVSRFVAEFVGKSNIFAGRISPAPGGRAVFIGSGFQMPASDCPVGEALALLRPEDVEIRESAPTDGRIALPVTVVSSTYSGDRALYTLGAASGVPILAYGSARTGVHPNGSGLFAVFAAENAVVLDCISKGTNPVSKLKHLAPAQPVIEKPGPERLLEGDPEFRSWPCSDEGPVQAGFWAATPGLHRMDRTGAGIEHFYLLEGEIELTEDGGAPRSFAAGDLVRIDPDFQGTWRTISPVRKVFFYVDP